MVFHKRTLLLFFFPSMFLFWLLLFFLVVPSYTRAQTDGLMVLPALLSFSSLHENKTLIIINPTNETLSFQITTQIPSLFLQPKKGFLAPYQQQTIKVTFLNGSFPQYVQKLRIPLEIITPSTSLVVWVSVSPLQLPSHEYKQPLKSFFNTPFGFFLLFLLGSVLLFFRDNLKKNFQSSSFPYSSATRKKRKKNGSGERI